jgi:hypothetical protein
MMQSLRARFGIALVALTAGCDSCAKHKPYVPFQLEAGSSDSVSAVGADGGAPAVAVLPQVDGGHLDVPQSTLAVAGLTFRAPEGRILTDVASQVGDHGGTLVALARDVAGQAPDVLVSFAYDAKNAGEAAIVAEGPAVPRDERCVQEATVRLSGRESAIARWRFRCPADVAPEPASILVVASVGPKARERFRVSYRDPVLELPLEVDADAADTDGDGEDDLRFFVRTETRAPYGQASLPLEYRWLERAAGRSPVPGVLVASWGALLKDLAMRAEEKSPGAFDAIASARTLVDAVCKNPAPVKVEHGGHLDACDAKAWGAALDTIERKAIVARPDPVLWAAYLSANPPPSTEVTVLEKGLAKNAPERAFSDVRREEALVDPSVADAGIAITDGGSAAAAAAPALNPLAMVVRSIDDRCTGSLSAHVELPSGRTFDVPLPLRSERRRGEASGCTIESLPPTAYRVLGALPDSVLVLVRGTLLSVEEGDADAGAEAPTAWRFFPGAGGAAKPFASSPIAIPTRLGLLVVHRAVERLTLPKDADASLAERWPPVRCVATEVPAVLRCEHAAGALFVTIPPPPRGAKKKRS